MLSTSSLDRIERAVSFRVTQVRRKWAGLRTFASDRSPAVGMEESTPGFFWLAGQGGYGIQTAPALARAAAKLLVEGISVPRSVNFLGGIRTEGGRIDLKRAGLFGVVSAARAMALRAMAIKCSA